MRKRRATQIVQFIAIASFAALSAGTRSFAQETALPQLNAYSVAVPWTGGTFYDALSQAASGATIPMASYAYAASKDGSVRTGLLVGGNPFGADPDPVTIHAVLIPLIVQVAGTTLTTFDPTVKNSCDGSQSAEYRFQHSPLVLNSPLTFNGVSVGKYQYINGFMRAEFWNQIHSTNFSDPISWSSAPAFTLPPFGPGMGIVNGTGCNELGIVSFDFLKFNIEAVAIPLLQAAGVISPTKFAVFLIKNVVASSVTPPTVSNCCIFGYHSATGSPAQTYGVMDYDTTGQLGTVRDISGPTHEIGEWMNDPLANNLTPAWGHIGQVSGCQGNFEVGDPLTGTNMPVIKMSGYNYHVQELAFFSWYFNSDTIPSIGAGGKFSGNGTFKGPSQPCPPGGTF
jgi:hypothetical protein